MTVTPCDLDMLACENCGDVEGDLYESLDGALFCADCMDHYAPQLVPDRRPIVDVHLPDTL